MVIVAHPTQQQLKMKLQKKRTNDRQHEKNSKNKTYPGEERTTTTPIAATSAICLVMTGIFRFPYSSRTNKLFVEGTTRREVAPSEITISSDKTLLTVLFSLQLHWISVLWVEKCSAIIKLVI